MTDYRLDVHPLSGQPFRRPTTWWMLDPDGTLRQLPERPLSDWERRQNDRLAHARPITAVRPLGERPRRRRRWWHR